MTAENLKHLEHILNQTSDQTRTWSWTRLTDHKVFKWIWWNQSEWGSRLQPNPRPGLKLLQKEILLWPSSLHVDQVSSCSDAPPLPSDPDLLCNYGRRDLLLVGFFVSLKEVCFLVFPKREQQQRGEEGAFPPPHPQLVQSPVPPSSLGFHIKALVENECRQLGVFCWGQEDFGQTHGSSPQTPVYEWSVAERENIPNTFFLSCLKESTCLVASRHVQLCGFAAGAAARCSRAPGQGAGRGRP